MRVQVLQHVPFEWIGSMEPWLLNQGATIKTTRLYDSEKLPDPGSVDLVIVMGGSMSANDEVEYPWLVPEKGFLREVIARGVPTLGVCLGAQLIASAHGATIARNPYPEIGWFPIESVPAPKGTFTFPARLDVFHWHGESFGLPPEASLLASSKACTNQAFQMGTNVIGMQFHLETTPETAALLVDNCGDELVEEEYVQSAEEIVGVHPERYIAIQKLSGRILEYVLGQNSEPKKRPDNVLYF